MSYTPYEIVRPRSKENLPSNQTPPIAKTEGDAQELAHSEPSQSSAGKAEWTHLILLIVAILRSPGALPTWPYSSGWGHYPSGGLGVVLIVLIVLLLMSVI